MEKRELVRQQWEQELWIKQHNTYVEPAEEIHSSQRKVVAETAEPQKAQPLKSVAGWALLVVGLGVGLQYPSKMSAVFALAAVAIGGSMGIEGMKAKHSAQRR